ncbi:MAG: pyridoxal phosphate-dependent decarboxylase family protein [Actinomycetota bacterium]
MTFPHSSEIPEVIDYVATKAASYLGALDTAPVRAAGANEVALSFGGGLPEEGIGGMEALRSLLDGVDGIIGSAGPRFFHFVVGGTTPAALGADWITSAWDQNNGAWVSAPLGARLEIVALAWLRELFGLPASWGGVLTTGATMANFTGIACARRWWAQQHGVDVDRDGLSHLPGMPVLSSGYIHPSATKALAMLGIGRGRVQVFTRDDVGRLDPGGMEDALRELGGKPGIIVANAGEVNAGEFDPIEVMADLAERYGCWLHVDGAFGLFAAASPNSRHLVAGIDRANSVIADGHKWLNVAYDCGFAFIRDPSLLVGPFATAAAYLPEHDEARPNYFNLAPESSRRARSFAVWATLLAYGRSGYRQLVEHHLHLARHMADLVDSAPDLERLAEVGLNIVCFRFRPSGIAGNELDELNRRLGEEVIADGRVYVGTTVYGGRVAFRPAIVNWQTTDEDVELVVDVVRELGGRLVG